MSGRSNELVVQSLDSHLDLRTHDSEVSYLFV